MELVDIMNHTTTTLGSVYSCVLWLAFIHSLLSRKEKMRSQTWI